MEFNPTIFSTTEAIHKTISNPDIDYCQPDFVYQLSPPNVKTLGQTHEPQAMDSALDGSSPNDPFYPRQKHLHYFGVDKAYQQMGFALGGGAVIHILDTGIIWRELRDKDDNIIATPSDDLN